MRCPLAPKQLWIGQQHDVPLQLIADAQTKSGETAQEFSRG
jgi:hypothetical protein